MDRLSGRPERVGCQMTRDELIHANLWRVAYHARTAAKRCRGRIEYQDFIGEGNLTLVQCANRFEECRGLQFSTFVERRLAGAMSDLIRRATGRGQQRHQEISVEAAFQLVHLDPDPTPEALADLPMRRRAVQCRLRSLPSLHQRVISARLANATQEQAADLVGFNQSRVSQVENEAVQRLKRKITTTLIQSKASAIANSRAMVAQA